MDFLLQAWQWMPECLLDLLVLLFHLVASFQQTCRSRCLCPWTWQLVCVRASSVCLPHMAAECVRCARCDLPSSILSPRVSAFAAFFFFLPHSFSSPSPCFPPLAVLRLGDNSAEVFISLAPDYSSHSLVCSDHLTRCSVNSYRVRLLDLNSSGTNFKGKLGLFCSFCRWVLFCCQVYLVLYYIYTYWCHVTLKGLGMYCCATYVSCVPDFFILGNKHLEEVEKLFSVL